MHLTLILILLCLLIVQSFPAPQVDFYAELGVSPTASEDDIKKAYRKAALIVHPGKRF
jgi:preprotein translocase subunit Sec63